MLNSDKFQKFKELLNRIELNYSRTYEDFDLTVESGLSGLLKETMERITIELGNDDKKNPALAIYRPDVIIIKEQFWDKTEEEQVCIVIHELGHVKYPPIAKTEILDVKPGEYLADRYILGVSIINKHFKFWLEENKESLNKLLGLNGNDRFQNLIQTYFTLKGFEKLLSEKDSTGFIKKIKVKLLEIGVANEKIEKIEELTEEYLVSYSNPDKLRKLEGCCDEIDQYLLNQVNT